jgi:enhancing lycopene biosynthesis protein 2
MKKNAKVGVLLSGCGFLDGAEIHEAVLTLLALDNAGAEAVCMAPDIDQAQVVNHLTGKPTGERRNVLVEAARIARGKIRDVAGVQVPEIDAVILPGGFGAAKNLSDFASKGAGMKVHPAVAGLLRGLRAASKPIGAICIAPAILAKLIPGVKLTIGDDAATAAALQQMGCRHEACGVTGIVVDEKNKVVSTPAYMLGPWVGEVAKGVTACVERVLAMVG